MKNSIIYAAILFSASLVPPLFAADQCITCHLELEEELLAPAQDFANDIHNQAGLSCAGCHGGNPTAEDAEEAMSEDAGFRGAPELNKIPELCGKCHADAAFMIKYNPALQVDQLTKYYTSVHGQKIRQGDNNAAQCASCHNAHDIRPANDPKSSIYPVNLPATCNKCHGNSELMGKYGIAADQYDLYAQSVHGKALLERKDVGAPACNDCHGNHGAVPPGITSVAQVCGTCHAHNALLFAESPHKQAFDEAGFPECVTCHSNHLVEKPSEAQVGVTDETFCINCHDDEDDNKGYKTAANIRRLLDSLVNRYESAKTNITTAEGMGMYVTDALFDLQETRQALIQARTLVHAFNYERLEKHVDKGLEIAAKVDQTAMAAIEESFYRRSGLAITVLLFAIFLLLMYLKLRSIERRQRR